MCVGCARDVSKSAPMVSMYVFQEHFAGVCCRLQEGVAGGCCRRVLQDRTLDVAGSHIAHEHIARNSQKNVSTVRSTVLFYRVAKTHRMP